MNLNFEEKINCFLGKNGSGKTNLLDAIYYLSFTKSAFNPYDQQNVRLDQTGFLIKGTFEIRHKQREVICSIRQGEKKNVLEEDQAISKFSDHVGNYPVVLIAPQDIELIWDGSELRRKFFDSLISQLDRIYLDSLIQYNHHLKQRNSLLRTFSERGKVDVDLIASYDSKLALAGNYIHKTRVAFIEKFKPIFNKHYDFLVCEPSEKVDITYRSDLSEVDFELLLKKNFQRDLLLQRTTSGVHRDDFLFTLNGLELKRVGSQGQQKSFLIGLKLAEFQILASEKQVKPLLLLDDIFDKLDDLRIQQLLKLVNQGLFGQLFITDARQGRSQQILTDAGLQAQLFIIESGTFRQEWLKT